MWKRAGFKTAFSPEIAILLAERPKNSRIPQMNSPTQLLEVYSSWQNCIKFIFSSLDLALWPSALER